MTDTENPLEACYLAAKWILTEKSDFFSVGCSYRSPILLEFKYIVTECTVICGTLWRLLIL